MQLKGVQVQVKMEGNLLPEYDVRLEGSSESEATCFVASEIGKVRS